MGSIYVAHTSVPEGCEAEVRSLFHYWPVADHLARGFPLSYVTSFVLTLYQYKYKVARGHFSGHLHTVR